MNVSHDLVVNAALDDVWQRIVTLAAGDGAAGSVKVRLAGSQATFRGRVKLTSRDDDMHRGLFAVSAKSARGGDTVDGTVTATFTSTPDARTQAALQLALELAGRPADLDQAAVTDVVKQALAQLGERLTAADTAEAPAKPAAAQPAAAKPPAAKKAATPRKAATTPPKPAAQPAPDPIQEPPARIVTAPASTAPAHTRPAQILDPLDDGSRGKLAVAAVVGLFLLFLLRRRRRSR